MAARAATRRPECASIWRTSRAPHRQVPGASGTAGPNVLGHIHLMIARQQYQLGITYTIEVVEQ